MSKKKESGYIDILIECPFCAAYVPDDFECLKCGHEIFESAEEDSVKYVCSSCGIEVEFEEDECPNCGVQLE
ncbi:MAG: double zinc ribbon domain-containing protein [Candidatus Saliniplasma sp.]